MKAYQNSVRNLPPGNRFSATDPSFTAALWEQGMVPQSPLEEGKVLSLKGLPLSLARGAKAIDVTSSIHDSYAAWARRISQELGVRFAGIDIRTDHIENPSRNATVLEVNANPALINLYRQGYQRQVRRIYSELLDAVLP